jgi:hypothetical protein
MQAFYASGACRFLLPSCIKQNQSQRKKRRRLAFDWQDVGGLSLSGRVNHNAQRGQDFV